MIYNNFSYNKLKEILKSGEVEIEIRKDEGTSSIVLAEVMGALGYDETKSNFTCDNLGGICKIISGFVYLKHFPDVKISVI